MFLSNHFHLIRRSLEKGKIDANHKQSADCAAVFAAIYAYWPTDVYVRSILAAIATNAPLCMCSIGLQAGKWVATATRSPVKYTEFLRFAVLFTAFAI